MLRRALACTALLGSVPVAAASQETGQLVDVNGMKMYYTAVITQVELLRGLIEPFLEGETPKGMFQ